MTVPIKYPDVGISGRLTYIIFAKILILMRICVLYTFKGNIW